MAFDYNKVLTLEVKKDIDRNVMAAKYEGNDFVRINAMGLISRFTEGLTTEQYRNFDWGKAEKVILNYASKVFKSKKYDSELPENKKGRKLSGMVARGL